jgi:hypothetical protein
VLQFGPQDKSVCGLSRVSPIERLVFQAVSKVAAVGRSATTQCHHLANVEHPLVAQFDEQTRDVHALEPGNGP